MYQREDEELIAQLKNNFQDESSEELLKIWKNNDRYSYRDEAFTAIREILTYRKLKIPKQDTPIVTKQPKKKTPINNELTTAILKTFLVFIVTSLLFGVTAIKFNLGNYIFDSIVFTNIHIMNGITLLTAALCSYFGYLIAGKKNRRKQNWAVLCFFLNIWGLILLGFVPAVSKDDV